MTQGSVTYTVFHPFRLNNLGKICGQIWHEKLGYLPKICGVCVVRPVFCLKALSQGSGWSWRVRSSAIGWIVINVSNNPLLPINRPRAPPMDLWVGRPSVPSKHSFHYCQASCTQLYSSTLIFQRPLSKVCSFVDWSALH